MNLKKVVFNNFRNYKNKHIFDLNKQITILYGENGNGKSSFFDGIEWCLTGGISRFSERKTPKEAIANNKILIEEECYVEIYFADLCIRRAFSRSYNGFRNIEVSLLRQIEFESFERIALGEGNVDLELRRIFEEKGVRYKDIKYKVGEIINKAYILSQDQVTDFVNRDSPNDRYNALASIMGFEKVLKFRKNISNSRKILQDNYLELESKKGEIEKSTVITKTKIKKIDNVILKKFLELKKNLPKDKNEINEQTIKLQNQIFTFESEIKKINEIKIEGIDKLTDFDSKVNLVQELINSNEKKLKNLIIEENNISTEIQKKNKAAEDLKFNQKVNNEFIEARENINKLLNQLNELKLQPEINSFEKIKIKKNKIELEQRKIDFAMNFKDEYKTAKSFLLNYDKNLKELQVSLKDQNENLNVLSKKEISLTTKLLNSDTNSSLNILIKSIEDINDFMKFNNQNGICPVCLSNVGEHLDIIIHSNLNHLIESVGKQKERVLNELKEKDNVELEVSKQRILIKNLEFKLEDLVSKEKISLETIKNIEENKLFGKFFIDNEDLYYEKLLGKNQINKLTEALKITNQIEEYKEAFELNSNVPKNIIDEDLQSLLENINTLLKSSNKIKERIGETEKSLSNNKAFIFTLENKRNEYERYFKKYNENSFNRIVKHINSLRLKVIELLKLYNDVSSIIESQDYNKEIEKDISILEAELMNNSKKRDVISNKIQVMNGILTILDREYGEEATDFLNNSNSSIQTYYRYLNPNASEYNNLHFEVTDNENLYIKIHLKNEDEEMGNTYSTDANMVLSSGQLNVLALAIFIATNEAQSCSYFDFIAIDDPIQNMDDINRFSISDILGNLNRQLIFSTHDQEFLNLFLKKNEFRTDEITIYSLNVDENIYKSILI